MRFAGYAALFDRPDRSGDIVRKGAFAAAVRQGPKGLPLLWQHEAGKPIGRIDYLAEDARGLRDRVDATSGSEGAWAMSLTGAELRLLPYLATHLMFPEIASRLFITRNTVKTEAVAIYRKLGVSSRSEAIERAVEVGLLESSVYPPGANLTPEV